MTFIKVPFHMPLHLLSEQMACMYMNVPLQDCYTELHQIRIEVEVVRTWIARAGAVQSDVRQQPRHAPRSALRQAIRRN